jgi:Zn-dependent alcohol dehydrogenase
VRAVVLEEVGDGVSRLRPGDRVVLAFNAVCGECWFCTHGQHSLCAEFKNLGAGGSGAVSAGPRPSGSGCRGPT